MSAFLDASVIVAVLSQEADGSALADHIASIAGPFFVSSLVRYEATVALARKKARDGGKSTQERLAEARSLVDAFVATLDAQEVPIAGEIGDRAILAASRFGKIAGHPAKLNFGDCFAYACAQSRGLPLLFKGDDFSQTDILIA